MIKKLSIYCSVAVTVIFALLFFLVFQFQKPNLPKTELNALNVTEFQKSAQVLMANSLQKPANISLSPRQVSYLAQKNRSEYKRYWFSFREIHFESQDNLGRITASLEGPFGIWLKVDWTGEVQLDNERKWSVGTETLWAGKIPIHWVFPKDWSPDWPTEFQNGRIRLLRAELDGRGLRARLNHSGLDLKIPGVDTGKSIIEKGVESLKNLF